MDAERLNQLLDSPDPTVRVKVVEALASVPSSASHLVRRLGVEKELQVKLVLVSVLGQVGNEVSLVALRGQVADADALVRRKVLEALFGAKDRTVFPLAVRMLSDLDPGVKEISFKILQRLGREGILSIIAKMLQSTDMAWQVSATSALGFLAGEDSVQMLIACLKHDTREVKLQALASLTNLARHGNTTAATAVQQARSEATSGSATAVVNISARTVPDAGSATLILSAPTLAAAEDPGNQTLRVPGPQTAPAEAATKPPPKPGLGTLDDSFKIKSKAIAPGKRYTTAKYKALFGESMPRIEPLTPEELVDPELTAEVEAPLAAAEAEPEPAKDGPAKLPGLKKKSKHWQDNVCRDCVFIKKERDDRQKMGPNRMWCSLLKKEMQSSKTCPKGKW